MSKSFYILDGFYQIYRAFYAPFRELTSPSGEPTRATHVFCQMLLKLIRDRQPDFLAMALDIDDATTFRRELDPQYKATRDPAPEGLHIQADRIIQIVKALGIPTYALRGFEADDLMATMAERVNDQDVQVLLVSRDKDLEQLITDRVHLFDVANDEFLDAGALVEKKGFSPTQAVDIQTLTGDGTDNIPGVPGIGNKTAVKLINKYGSAGAVLEHANELTPKMSERVRAFADQIDLTRTLVTLRRDAPMKFSLDDCTTTALNFAALRPIFAELDFHRLSERIDELCDGESDSTDTPPPQPDSAKPGTYKLVNTEAALDEFAQQLGSQKTFAFDTETTGLNPVTAQLVGLSFSWKSGEAYYIPIRAAMGSVLPVPLVVQQLAPIMANPSILKIGQNLKYDVLVLRQVGMDVNGLAFDTMIANFLLDPLARSHSLDGMVKRFFGHDMIPITELIGKGKNQITLDQLDAAVVGDYAAEDADFTWRLYESLEPQMTGSHVERLFRETEMPLVEVLAEMEHTGIALDQPLLKRLGESMGDRMIELTRDIHKAAEHEFNIDSTKQIAAVLFDEQGLTPVRRTKTGRSTDAETLRTLVTQTDHPIPKLVLEYRELAKLKSTYVETLPKMVSDRTGRIHGSFDQTGAVTGRLSSSNPNLQNIPIRTEMGRRIRQAIIPSSANSVLLAADYSQVELRLLAHFCKDEALQAAFHSGLDIHKTVAAQVHGVELDAVTSEQRSAAKAVNFGIIYGQSAFGLAKGLGIGVSEARAFIDAYFDRYAGIRTFIDECVARARELGYVETILGRRRPVPELQSRNRQQVSLGERIAVNTIVQGSAADLIKRAMINIHSDRKQGTHNADLLIQVHDELVFEVSLDETDAAASLIRKRMEGAMSLSVPLVVDIAWGATWADTK